MSNVENQISDVVIVRVNGGTTRSGAGKDDTVVSAINGGAHLNIYPSDAQMEVVGKWAAALAEFGLVNGVVEFLRLQEANRGGGYTCRSRKRQGNGPTSPFRRKRLAVPTTSGRRAS